MQAITSKDQDVKQRVQQLVDYLVALHHITTPPHVNLDQYVLVLHLRGLPSHPAVQWGRLPLSDTPMGDDTDFILKLSRPSPSPCPPLPPALEGWIQPGWETAGATVVEVGSRSDGQKFGDNAARAKAFKQWKRQRHEWARAEKRRPEVVRLYDKVLGTWTQLQQEQSKRTRVLFGDAVLSATLAPGEVYHPLIQEEIEIRYDANASQITFARGRGRLELNFPLLRACKMENENCVEYADLLNETDKISELIPILWPQESRILSDAVICMGSQSPSLHSLERFLEELPQIEQLPPVWLRMVGERRQPDSAATAQDALFTLPSTPQQRKTVAYLSKEGCVVLQGGAGTGKTHTIANIIGHVLAHGKSVLVLTNHPQQLRATVHEPLRPLCIAVQEREWDNRAQLESLVNAMAVRATVTDPENIATELTETRHRRSSIVKRLNELQTRLKDTQRDLQSPIELGNDTIAADELRQRLEDGRGHIDWIPRPIEKGSQLPLSAAEVAQVYQCFHRLHSERGLLDREPLGLDAVPSAEAFTDMMGEHNGLHKLSQQFPETIWEHADQTAEQLEAVLTTAAAVASFLQRAPRGPYKETQHQSWLLECARAGMAGGSQRQSWEEFVVFLEENNRIITALEKQVVTNKPVIKLSLPQTKIQTLCDEILAHLRAGKSLAKVQLLMHSEWKVFLEGVTVNAKPVSTLQQMESISALLRLKHRREALCQRWQRQMTDSGGLRPNDLGDKPEQAAMQTTDRIRSALAWSQTLWPACQAAMQEAGLKWDQVLEQAPPDPKPQGDMHRMHVALDAHLKPIIESRKALLLWRQKDAERHALAERLSQIPAKQDYGDVAPELHQAVEARDVEAYRRAFSRLQQVHQQRGELRERQKMLARIELLAPAWAAAILEHRPPHDGEQPPGDVEEAWRYRQMEDILAARADIELDLRTLQQDVARLRRELDSTNVGYVEQLAWAAQTRRIKPRQRRMLVGFLTFTRKIGPDAKLAWSFKSKIRARLAECREAVPGWIMTRAQAAELYAASQCPFDVVIVDDASEADLTDLVMLSLGRQMVVVGDSEKAKLAAPDPEVAALAHNHLANLPNADWFDARMSLFEVARRAFRPFVRLDEQFSASPAPQAEQSPV